MAARSDYEIVFPEQSLPTARMVGLGMQHVIAMFGATVLAPFLMGFDPNLAIVAAKKLSPFVERSA